MAGRDPARLDRGRRLVEWPTTHGRLDVRRGLWTVQVDALLGGFEGAEVGLVLDVGHGDRVCAQRHRGEPVAPSERVSNSLQGGDGGYRPSQC